MNSGTAEERIAQAVIGLNIIALAISLYGYAGTDIMIGAYHGEPVFYYVPTKASTIASLVLVAVGLVITLSAGGRSLLAKRREVLVVTVVVATIITGLVASQASRMVKVSITEGKYDSYVLQVLAARALLSGHNPYLLNYTAALISSVPASYLTFLFRSGPPYNVSNSVGIVHVLDYPAFSFLYYVPAVLLRIPGDVWDAAVLGATLSVVFIRLRDRYRGLLLPILSAGMLFFLLEPTTYDPMAGWLAPVLLVLVFSSNPVVSGVLLGLATSYREYAIVPAMVYFVLAAKRGVKRVGFGVLAMAVTIVAVNAPFLVWTGPLLIKEVLMPVKYRLDIEGLGLASVYFLTGKPLPKDPLLAATAALVLLTPVLTYYLYDSVGGLAYTIAALPFMFYPRPLYSYWAWFPWIGVIDYLLNDLNRKEVPLGDENKSFLASALSPLVAISVMVASLSSAEGGLVNPYLLALGGVGIFMSLVFVLTVARPRLYRVLVPAVLIAGLVGSSLVVRQYSKVTDVVMNVLRSPGTTAHINPVTHVQISATDTGPVLVQLVLPYSSVLRSSLIITSVITTPPVGLAAPSFAMMQFWTSVAIAGGVILAYILSRSSLLEIMLISMSLGAAVFVATSPLTSLALLAITTALALSDRFRLLGPALTGAASLLSPIGLMAAIASIRKPSRLSALVAVAFGVIVAVVLRGSYLSSVLFIAPKYLRVYMVVGYPQLVEFVAVVTAAILVPLIAISIVRLRSYSLASVLVSLAAIAVAGLWDPSYAIGYIAFTVLPSIIALNGGLKAAKETTSKGVGSRWPSLER